MKWLKKRIGLVLGGGGARGLSHIGVLRVFEQEDIPVDIIVGTSIGAMIGGAYACGISSQELERKIREYVSSAEFQSSAIKAMGDIYGREWEGLTQKIQSFLKNQFYLIQMLFKPGVLSLDTFQSMIHKFIPDVQIEDTRIPFRAVATDLITGEQIVFDKGSLRKAVIASSAVPGAIEPVRDGERLLSDGGIISLIPVNIARKEGADVVIAVAVDRDFRTDEELKTAKDIYYRACEITSSKLEEYELMGADIIIRPDVKNIHWTGFAEAIDLIREGEKAARERIRSVRDKRSIVKTWINSIKTLGSHRPKQNGSTH
ncbi:MAG: patatin-like phospholipase family protein [Syntrophaceae bacterium]|nr:patatin-like phospholipase family protein [Syntrophaceae bacterium]